MPIIGRRFVFSTLPQSVYAVMLMVTTIFVGTHPKIGWDALGYVGVIESWHTSDSRVIQANAYSALRSVHEYDELTGSAPCQPPGYAAYRADVANNSAHFAQQLPVLAIKPLYVVFVFVLHNSGLSYVRSFAAVSAVAYGGLGVITWLWLCQYWSKWAATVFGSLMLVNPELLTVVRATSPDGLALLFVIFGIYMLLEHAVSVWGPIFLLISIWVRPDSLILVGLLLATTLLLQLDCSTRSRSGWNLRLLGTQIVKNWVWLVFCALALLSYFAIQRAAHFYSWSTLFYHSFVSYLVAPADTSLKVTPRLYFHIVAVNARGLLGNSELALLLLIGFVGAALHTRINYRYITICVIAAMFVHFLFFPTDSSRFHVAATVFLPVSLLIACASHSRLTEEVNRDGHPIIDYCTVPVNDGGGSSTAG